MSRLSINILAIVATFAFYIPPVWAEAEHTHHHEEKKQGAIVPQLNHGKLWATDSSLRQGMERVRDAALLAYKASINGAPNKEAAAALASSIDDALAFMFEHCRLEPGADANLHILLEQLMRASDSLKKNPDSTEGLLEVFEVLKVYPHYFEHTGWKPVSQNK